MTEGALSSLRYLFALPVVARTELLRRALASVPALHPQAQIIDNTVEGLDPADWPVPVYRPSVPLSVSQTVNYLRAEALRGELNAIVYMHNDAEAHPGTDIELLTLIGQLTREQSRWGIVFTNYDTLVAFSVRMLAEVGEWDVILPQYFADCDYYRRVRLAGFEVVESQLAVTHVEDGSNTIRSTPQLNYLNGVTFPLYQQYYERKWGGPPGGETFVEPFNGALK